MSALDEVSSSVLVCGEVYAAVTDEETTAVVARPMEVPSWLSMLKTAPARAWVRWGNEDEVMRMPTVKRTSTEIGARSCSGLSQPS